MSYDLFFGVPPVRQPPSPSAICEYFLERKHYEVSESQAVYRNEDTGVYFAFDIEAPKEPQQEDEADPSFVPCGIAFNLNYYRPHIFGLEAEPEVASFTERFDLLVDDPQIDGMGRGHYSSERFLAGWNTGNRFAYKALLTKLDASDVVDTLPFDAIERYWRWNLTSEAMQEQVTEPAFVPRVMFMREAGRVASFVTWTDAIPIVIPKVDYVVLARREFATGPPSHGKFDFAVVRWKDLEARALPRSPYSGPLECWLIREGKGRRSTGSLLGWLTGLLGFGLRAPPPEVANLFKEAPSKPKPLEGIPVDQILDEEMVHEYRP